MSGSATKVKVFKPKAIVLGFHGTIAPSDWEEKCLMPYIRDNLLRYLRQNWNNETISRLIPKLRHESFEQHYVFENNGCPVVTDDDTNEEEQIQSLNDFLIWQMNCGKDLIESKIVYKMAWMEGLDNRQIQIKLFNDVFTALQKFKNEFNMKIAIISATLPEVCRKFFETTSEGDINKFIDKYFDHSFGNSKDPEAFKNIAKELSVEPKDILYVTNYGQSAKCAKELGIQSLLIVRENNPRIREYYLLRFSQIQSLLDIEFVPRI